MNKYAEALLKIAQDSRYKEGVAYGKPRKGHQEGTIGNHIKELTENLDRLKLKISGLEAVKLLLLIHVHDIMKYKAKRNSPISDPESHATLAREFLKEFLYTGNVTEEDTDLLMMVQYHDVNHALWQKQQQTGHYDLKRLRRDVIDQIKDLELYCIFTIVDGFTTSKDALDRGGNGGVSRLRYFIEQINKLSPVPRSLKMLELFGL